MGHSWQNPIVSTHGASLGIAELEASFGHTLGLDGHLNPVPAIAQDPADVPNGPGQDGRRACRIPNGPKTTGTLQWLGPECPNVCMYDTVS